MDSRAFGLVGQPYFYWDLDCFCAQHFGYLYHPKLFGRRLDIILYLLGFLLALSWYFSLDARQDRDWQPEVAKILHYEKQGDHVTLHNVRNLHGTLTAPILNIGIPALSI